MTKRSQIKHSAEQLLEDLGASVGEVVDSFTKAGITGEPKNPSGCAIARYINAVMGADPQISDVLVTQDFLSVRLTSRVAPSLSIKLPKALQEFTVAFDSLEYPQLVRARPVAVAVSGGSSANA